MDEVLNSTLELLILMAKSLGEIESTLLRREKIDRMIVLDE